MPALPAKLRKPFDTLSAAALRYPETAAAAPFGYFAAKVRGKGFLGMKWAGDVLCVSMKLPYSGVDALSLPFTEPTHGGLGKSGWISALFTAGEPVPFALLAAWIDESYRANAPKALADTVSGGAAAPAARTGKPKAKAKAKTAAKPKSKTPKKAAAKPATKRRVKTAKRA